ncbi:uncharacterized protein NECHADRAFT_95150 [Fusarium vanettenii 77-13-4]|uniref:AMP-dependent synthetase/ligase domain-containing protein n=1 Tax=Fusarium vanettenii (strain ATCC MYA-4622 / CBS 123669 / FGSC 9596 / NRRL 45880 / 77-13-4) TaxID=660122 RepID=C7ZAZ5_FUSV7|nr:uncharacterized protein NECHADRAFT_95150 [Fusarium vanettenii 77-13-4]EEU38679.1 hypothetical protein NECHADRAFT_95150 [Fusarium vanettenii 77-13-4]
MTTYQTPLAALYASTRDYPSATALRIPNEGMAELSWKDITFTDFTKDIETCARYWANEFLERGIQQRSVIGLWLKGSSYTDLLHIWGIYRAGFIPQLVSLKMTDPSVVYNLLKKSQAAVLIHDAGFQSVVADSPVKAYPAEDILTSNYDHLPLPHLNMSPEAENTIMIYHTSGSTSGIPKLVPLTAKWFDCVISKTACVDEILPSTRPQRVQVSIGSFSHIGSTMLLIDAICRGSCFVLPTEIPYSNDELRQIIDQCGLTRLNMFPAFLSNVLHEARRDASLLKALQGLEYIMYGGSALDPTDEAWACSQGLHLVNVFGSTEVGVMMISEDTTNPAYLTTLSGSTYEYVPLEEDTHMDERLLELVVVPESADCPDISLRSSEDGKFHTGDFFVEVRPGKFVAKGRNDDWIKMAMALRCDTGSIEANAMETCGDDLIDAVVVVGAGRPSPSMIVELRDGASIGPEEHDEEIGLWRIKNEILFRINPFHKRRYMHERIDDARFILIVPRGTLPRTATKGNIRRKQVEEMFKSRLDKVYKEWTMPKDSVQGNHYLVVN